MNRALNLSGIILLAFMLFVGLVHVFIRVQGKDSPETLGSLHGMPVIGGFFFAPHTDDDGPSTDEKRETKARRELLESREFFPLPEGFDRKGLDELMVAAKDALTSYEQGLLAVEKERADLSQVRAEVEAEKTTLESAAKDLLVRAQDLERGREEMDLRANRMASEEARNLKASTALYEQMPADDAAKILGVLEVDVVARILMSMSPRKSGKIVAALPTARAVEVTRRMQAIVKDPPRSDAAKKAAADR